MKPSDNPIKKDNEDSLSRVAVANTIAKEIASLDASEGYAIGVLGKWGSGKTSLVNLIKLKLSNPVVSFNPWMFSGSEQLVTMFFNELSSQLKLENGKKFDKIADQIATYGDLLNPIIVGLGILPVVGGWFERVRNAAGAYKKFKDTKKKSATAQRTEIAKGLAKLEQPIVVIIDDIDRLEAKEVRDIFKLVRLTASFPNIIYVLAFDREQVEKALTETGINGRNYLEKIIQVVIDVPVISDTVLITQLGKALEQTLDTPDNSMKFDEGRWADTVMEIVYPLMKNMRDVRRYTISARITVNGLLGQVELGDILALEAVRIMLPDVFAAIVKAQDGLTDLRDHFGGSRYEPPRLKQSIDDLMNTAGDDNDKEIAKALIERIFPAAKRHLGGSGYSSEFEKSWLKERRAAHKDILKMYLERTASQGLNAFNEAEKAYALLNNEIGLNNFLRSINNEAIEDVIAALENYEGTYPLDGVVPGSIVLLNLLPHMPERPRNMLTFVDARLVISRVVLRLLRQLNDPQAATDAVSAIIPRVTDLSSQFELIRLVGHEEGVGHKLVSETDAKRFEAELATAINSASSKTLANETELLRLLLFTKKLLPEDEIKGVAVTNSKVSARLLLASRYEVKSQSFEERSVKRQTRLSWDVLKDAVGGESRLAEVVAAAKKYKDKDAKLNEAIVLAEKYMTGWRPERNEDD